MDATARVIAAKAAGLRHLEAAVAQGRDTRRHRTVRHTLEPVGVDAGEAQIVLQAHPGRRHLGDGGEPPARQIRKPERRAARAAHQIEGIARHHLAEAHQRRRRLAVMRLHDPHGAAPGQVDAAVEQSRHRVAGHRRIDEVDLDAFAFVEAERLGGVEGRIEDRAEILGQPDFHAHPFMARRRANGRAAVRQHPNTAAEHLFRESIAPPS
jgi:hypothetical protein